jgi:hypothetical protein
VRLAGREAIGSPIVEDEEIDPDKHPKQPREAAITVSEIGKQRRDARIVDRVTERLCMANQTRLLSQWALATAVLSRFWGSNAIVANERNKRQAERANGFQRRAFRLGA